MGSKAVATAMQDLDRCESLLKSLDQQLESLRHWKALEQQLDPLQQARMHLAIAASASAVYQTLLRLRGPSPEEQAHVKELDRLETYKKKVTKLESEKWLQEHRPSLSVDVASANRFISAAIPELTPEQKHALRQAGKKHGETAAEDHNASSSAAASQFLDSLATPPAPEDALLQTGFRANFQRGDVTKDPRAGSIHVTTGSVHVTTGSVHVTASGSDGPARSKRGPGPGPRSDPVPKSKSQGPCNYGMCT
ncbi:g444 [Coccomyxa viridis]|uniref:Nuclear nucleic acid-binding protein C1D n=1 Tax=Coccomyxa viridis TaxID=1274662 RepID=A0ABP1FJE3_9CHLO